ncbi:hypothetical protein [Ralstonia solanacearum]|uniref:hypothetical protein n=1 Tax=Ralstonia solanacearum TaxID=305 RepID=UPI00130129DB|nr:hypothetical protein [Ralstonia solanacearum]
MMIRLDSGITDEQSASSYQFVPLAVHSYIEALPGAFFCDGHIEAFDDAASL